MSTRYKKNPYNIDISDKSVTSLKVENRNGKTEIVNDTSTITISVTEKIHYRDKQPLTSHSITDHTLIMSNTPSGEPPDDYYVNYEVTVPQQLQLILISTNGEIDAQELANTEVDVQIANQGQITLKFTAPPTTANARIANEGSITMQLPAGTAYAVDAKSRRASAPS